MATRILIPTPLRPFTGQQAAVAVDGHTVGELLRNLTDSHAGLRPHLFGADGSAAVDALAEAMQVPAPGKFAPAGGLWILLDSEATSTARCEPASTLP